MANELKLSVFGTLQAYESKPLTLETILWWISHDESVAQKTELYRNMARTITPDEAKKKVKEAMMPAFSVAVVFRERGRQTQHVASVTGLSLCDIDHLDDIDAAFAQIAADPHTLLLYRTISGEGLRCIYRYVDEKGKPPQNALLYRAAYHKGNTHFARLAGKDYDGKCGDLTRLSGMAHDPEAYYNPDAEPFTITDAEAAEANLDPSTEPGKPRKNEPAGTYKTAADEAWGVVEKMLAKRDVVYGPGTHHAFVMHAVHLFNRFGTSEESLTDWAAQAWADYGQKERNAIIKWVYAHRQSQHGIWRLSKSGRNKKDSNLSLQDQIQWLSDQGIEIIYNQITDQSSFRRGPDKMWEQLDERAVCTLRKDMNIETRRWVAKGDVNDIVKSDVAKLIHPVRDYIQRLPKWDGTDRVAELADHVVVDPVQTGQSLRQAHQLFRWALHKWLVASVATWLCDDTANQTILTLIGEQGIYKTTWFSHLLPPQLRHYFRIKVNSSKVGKDDLIAMSQFGLVCYEELDVMRPSEVNTMKTVVTMPFIDERRPYGHYMEHMPHVASFCGTGNNIQFLNDSSGNRRWLPFEVESIESPREHPFDYEAIYSEAYALYRQGFRYYFSKAEEEVLKAHNEVFETPCQEKEVISRYFRQPHENERGEFYTATDILLAVGASPVLRLTVEKIGAAMRSLGYQPHRSHGRRGFRVVAFKAEEIEQNRRILAYDAKDNDDCEGDRGDGGS